MSGAKSPHPIDLNMDQLDFIRSTKEKYSIPDESKLIRIVIDYLALNQDIHNTVFSEPRCRNCH